ncbi:hypothetical protein Rhopal_006240-T1 [Rhodotorula paludigena]|uniref:Uncharacterized protein n=1 Tax=Rhodotorula paludigena TaxID=86838 RepID=A0AAV5GSI6_9BASI|nr:hypothetical protein Rhopal_006240-T1 [Rhodotorula paludigena]
MEVAPRTLFTEVIRLVDEEAGINWTQPAVADPPGLIKQAASSLATLSTSKGGAKQQRGRLDNLIQATAASVTAAGRASLAKDASSVAPASTAGGVGAAAAGPSKARCGCKFGGASGLSSTAKGKGKDTLVDLTPPPSEDGDRDDHGMSRFGRALADVVGGEVNEVTPAGLVAAMETFVRTLLPKTYAAWESGPSTSCRSLRSNDPTNRTRARLRKLSDGEVEEVDT